MHKVLKCDIAIIGSGPAGEKAAMQASKLKKKVLLIEKSSKIGGASLHTGTIPSKSLRETVVNLELLKRRTTHGIRLSFKDDMTAEQLMYRKEMVINELENSFRRNISKNNITLLQGTPVFKSPTKLEVNSPDYTDPVSVEADFVIIATGSTPRHPDWAQFDNETVFDSDTILNIKYLPKKITIVGAGVIGCEYACMIAKLGIRVNLVARDRIIMRFLDREISENLMYRMRNSRVTLRLGESVQEVRKISSNEVSVILESGKVLPCSTVLVAAGRTSNVEGLGLEEIGVHIADRGLITINEHYQTSVPNIYAVGDVVGFPALASTSMVQARIAVAHAFGVFDQKDMPKPGDFPIGVWTIPAIAMVGKTEEELTDQKIPYEIGVAHFKEVARARIMGEEEGILKLLFDPDTLKVLGVHIIGPRAAELIHLGHSVMFHEGTIQYFMNAVFNYPTLDEAYRIAAFNGMNRLDYVSL